ncbi:MAG: hypothetical protein IT207_01840 [Fimbriimonadaceae bacterium]|nr:hypothetical protein [Fimbriimonadaceae bacterium]
MPYVTPEGAGRLPDFSGANRSGAIFCAEDWGVVLGGQGAACLGIIELWLRLLATGGWEESTATILAGWDWAKLETAIPRSRQERTFAGEGELPAAFAWVRGHFALGAPTEEAWDRFVAALQRS